MAPAPRGDHRLWLRPGLSSRDGGRWRTRTMAELADSRRIAISHRGVAVRAVRAVARERPGSALTSSWTQKQSHGASRSIQLGADPDQGDRRDADGLGGDSDRGRAFQRRPDRVAGGVCVGADRRRAGRRHHRYGHEKVENLAAAFEAILILVGSLAIAFEAIRRLIVGGSTHTLGFGIAVIGFSAVANTIVSVVIARGGRLHRLAGAPG